MADVYNKAVLPLLIDQQTKTLITVRSKWSYEKPTFETGDSLLICCV